MANGNSQKWMTGGTPMDCTPPYGSFPKMGVPENHLLFRGFYIISHPFLRCPNLWNPKISHGFSLPFQAGPSLPRLRAPQGLRPTPKGAPAEQLSLPSRGALLEEARDVMEIGRELVENPGNIQDRSVE